MQAELASHELLIANLDAKAKYEALQRAQAALDRRQIVSRINGVVVKSLKHEGEWVQPGEPVMRIVQMDRLRVEGEIDGRKYARHEVIGRPVRITVFLTGGGQETLEGKIVYASSIVESNEYTVRAEIDNRKLNGRWLLTPGLNAKMDLLSGGDGADTMSGGLDEQLTQQRLHDYSSSFITLTREPRHGLTGRQPDLECLTPAEAQGAS